MVEIWQYILGAIFVLTILFFKGGLVGIVRDQLPEWKKKINPQGGRAAWQMKMSLK